MPAYYPVYLDLNGRPCVVVGGEGEAERKVQGLLEHGARVTLISPEVRRCASRPGPAAAS